MPLWVLRPWDRSTGGLRQPVVVTGRPSVNQWCKRILNTTNEASPREGRAEFDVRPLGGNNFREKVLRPDVKGREVSDEMVALTDARLRRSRRSGRNDRNQALQCSRRRSDRDRGIGQHEETLGFQFFAYPVGQVA